MNFDTFIEQYLAGPDLLRRAIAGMKQEQLLARPTPGKWSTQEVVCHLADYDPIYADRMKRVIALDEPELLKGDPKLFAARLAYDHGSSLKVRAKPFSACWMRFALTSLVIISDDPRTKASSLRPVRASSKTQQLPRRYG